MSKKARKTKKQTMKKPKIPGRLPGDPSKAEMIKRMIRVDQAGEYGAVRIYEGQLSVLGKSASAPALEHMAEQERRHLDAFNKLIPERRVRPTALLPLWHVAGFALGAGTALLGEKAAHACTVAVEEVIDEHYAGQIARLDALGKDRGGRRSSATGSRNSASKRSNTSKPVSTWGPARRPATRR